MSQQSPIADRPSLHMPTSRGALLRLVLAAVVGLLLLFLVVLPAEYRVDPTGFGRLTGLLDLTTPRVDTAAAAPAAATAPADPLAVIDAPTVDAKGDPIPVVVKVSPQVSRTYPMTFRSETVQIPLGPDGELEYKVRMLAGSTLIYSWQTDQGTVYYDFHGEPADPKNSQSYIEVQETPNANGAFVAPFDGIHGWFWLNLTSKPMVVTLKMSGFYESGSIIK